MNETKFKTEREKYKSFPHSNYEGVEVELCTKYIKNYMTHDFLKNSNRCFNCNFKMFEFSVGEEYVLTCAEYTMEQILK